ncbi:MAG: TRAP transporter large permease [Desulfocucumaceae bacterium]
MSGTGDIIWLFIPFAVALIIGVPISFCLALGVIIFISVTAALPIDVLTMQMFQSASSFPMMAIPFFILAGDLMERAGISRRLMDFVRIIFGRFRGGQAQVMVGTEVIFSGLSGSAVADTAAMLKIVGPSMEKSGYPKDYVAALAAACGVLGPIIPPSIIMIVYGATLNVSVGALFVGGILPGILIAGSLVGLNYYYAIKHKYPRSEDKISAKILLIGLKDASLALIIPIIIIFGIRGGVFTPTEGGAVAAAYSLFLGIFVYRTLKIKDIADSALVSGVTSAVILLIIAASNPFGWVMSVNMIPQQFAQFILAFSTDKFVIITLINILLLLAGALMEGAAIILLLGPILAPIAVKIGMDPVHFAMMVIVNISIGMITPPVGVNLFAAVPIAKTTMTRISRAILPFIVVELVALAIIVLFPQITLWLPNLVK